MKEWAKDLTDISQKRKKKYKWPANSEQEFHADNSQGDGIQQHPEIPFLSGLDDGYEKDKKLTNAKIWRKGNSYTWLVRQ